MRTDPASAGGSAKRKSVAEKVSASDTFRAWRFFPPSLHDPYHAVMVEPVSSSEHHRCCVDRMAIAGIIPQHRFDPINGVVDVMRGLPVGTT